ncbi:hypothetical protein S7335_5537 [Synechococcus sp. PCC 7335]|uniref:hypothetical protein n=1 Tax=Synechococcus sp. (strain ATCC 29403 / PCC 7335) TaxID=91464 RepID=UPI00017EDD25|nr:hypothetical protein [Synechococcus sp. PCC 7335]EDX87827.1 hypothetical protein S7335_5537 [Synechococcus sp. PCC 7335]
MGELLTIIVLGVYLVGGWRFWSGFNRTNFTDKKVFLTLMWPILLISNQSYRKNFSKALKGS